MGNGLCTPTVLYVATDSDFKKKNQAFRDTPKIQLTYNTQLKGKLRWINQY
jgi:hypothetical protein